IASETLDEHIDVTPRHTGVSRMRENARSDLAGAGTDLLMTREVRVDAGNVCDRSRIRRARADARPPQPREQARTVRPVPRQDGEAQGDGAGPVDRSRNLDSFDALDTRAQPVGVISPSLVVGVEAGEDPRGQPSLVRGEARDPEIRLEVRCAELEKGGAVHETDTRRHETGRVSNWAGGGRTDRHSQGSA